MLERMKFTKTNIKGISRPDDKRREYGDTEIKQLRLRVTPTGIKSFSVYMRVAGGGKPRRITLGRFPDVSPDRARKEATRHIANLASGIDPNREKQTRAARKVTLQELFKLYKLKKKDTLKPTTIKGYNTTFNCHLTQIQDLQLAEITRKTVIDRFTAIESKSQANYAMRILKALFHFAESYYVGDDDRSLFPENPVRVIGQRKMWHKIPRKQTHVKDAELPKYLETLQITRENGTQTVQAVCDSLEFALLTGLRKGEVLNLKWSDIDYKNKFFLIRNPKNHINLEWPLTSTLEDLLNRQEGNDSLYVFAADNEYGQIREPKKIVAKIKEDSGTDCNYHDLRRTFTTTAERLNLGGYTIKRLVNHISMDDDVTAGYMVLTADALRNPAEQIQREIIRAR